MAKNLEKAVKNIEKQSKISKPRKTIKNIEKPSKIYKNCQKR